LISSCICTSLGSDCRIDCNNTEVCGKVVISVEVITDAVVTDGCVTDGCVTDGCVTAIGIATQHTGLLTGVGNVDGHTVQLNSFLKCCSAIDGVLNCFASLTVALVLHDAPVRV